jgi:hypothetical protein
MTATNRKSWVLRIPYMDTKRNVVDANSASRPGYQVIRSANFGLDEATLVIAGMVATSAGLVTAAANVDQRAKWTALPTSQSGQAPPTQDQTDKHEPDRDRHEFKNSHGSRRKLSALPDD